MKKKVFFVLSATLTIFFSSCASIIPLSIGNNAAFTDMDSIEQGYIELSCVDAVIDQVPDKEVASQIELLASNYLNSCPYNIKDNINEGRKIGLSIRAVQRSYLEGTSMVNAIFFSFAFSEEKTGGKVCVINEFSNGEKTLYSSKVQQKFLSKALNQYFKQKNARKK